MTMDDGGPRLGAVADLILRLRTLGKARGNFAALGASHAALFVDASPEVLLVTCERLDTIAARDENALPFGLTLADMHGWSQLSLLAVGETGWREPRLWRQLDRLVDADFFEDYGRVVFYGSGLAGYAAAAFSVAAPGSTVLALAPRATLATDRAGWDDRHPALRRADFTSRYGYAPDMIEGAGPSFVIHDPWEHLDSVHASLFAHPHVARLGWRGLGADPEERLAGMGLLAPLIVAACQGTLTPASASALWRRRRRSLPWLRSVVDRAETRHRRSLALRLCRYLARRHSVPYFQKRLEELDG